MTTLSDLAHTYFLIQVIVCAAYGIVKVFQKLSEKTKLELPAMFWRKLNHWVLIAALLLPVVSGGIAFQKVFAPPIQIWSEFGKSFSETSMKENVAIKVPQFISNDVVRVPSRVESLLSVGFFAMVLAFALAHLGRMILDFFKLKNLLKTGLHLKSYGNVTVLIADDRGVPFVTGLGKKGIISLPSYLLQNPENLRIALAHEFQHLKHGDVVWAYALELIKAFFFLNPLIHAWIKDVQEIHEFACDEALLGRPSFDETAYGRCLLEVATYAHKLGNSSMPSGTVAMSSSQKLLTRRVQMIITHKPFKKTWAGNFMIALALGLTGTLALASNSVVSDRRVTMEEATKIAAKTSEASGIEIVVDENVLKFLNKAVGNERSRMYFRSSLKRMKTFEPMITKKMNAAHLPQELLAVPIVESGYQNTDNGTGAGIWSFIPNTARVFGLTVNDDLDERFDVEKESDAAVQYYTKLHSEFKDWHLALLAYNAGEKTVRSAIEKTGIHDAFKLVREHHMPKEQDYLPMTMAAIIIYKNPSLIKE